MAAGGLTTTLVLAVMIACVGTGFQHGWHTGIFNTPEKVLRAWMNKSMSGPQTEESVTLYYSIAASIYTLGGMLGGIITGVLVDWLGIKWSLVANTIFVIVPGIMILIIKYFYVYPVLVLARFIIGINSGLAGGICPLFLNEISPIKYRGGIASMYQLMITISILLSQVLGMSMVMGTDKMWHFLLGGICIFPALLLIIGMPFCPESPKFLLGRRGKPEEAEKALKWYRKMDDVKAEIAEMEKESAAGETVSYKDLFVRGSLRKPLGIILMVMLAQQLSGINAVMFYSKGIFESAGLNEIQAQIGTVVVGVVNVIMTVVSVAIVDKAGRKTLLLIGLIGSCVFMAFLMIFINFKEKSKFCSILSVVSTVFYVVFFAVGLGPIPWFLPAEMFLKSAKPKAISLAVTTNWFANFLVTLTFKPVEAKLGPFVFGFFIVFLILFSIFTVFKVPETRGKPVEETAALYTD